MFDLFQKPEREANYSALYEPTRAGVCKHASLPGQMHITRLVHGRTAAFVKLYGYATRWPPTKYWQYSFKIWTFPRGTKGKSPGHWHGLRVTGCTPWFAIAAFIRFRLIKTWFLMGAFLTHTAVDCEPNHSVWPYKIACWHALSEDRKIFAG